MADRRLSGRSWIDSFEALLTTAAAPLYKDSDKNAHASLQVFKAAFRHSRTMDVPVFNKLTKCSVDGITGRPVLMKLIERGFIQTLKNDAAWNDLLPTTYDKLDTFLDKVKFSAESFLLKLLNFVPLLLGRKQRVAPCGRVSLYRRFKRSVITSCRGVAYGKTQAIV